MPPEPNEIDTNQDPNPEFDVNLADIEAGLQARWGSPDDVEEEESEEEESTEPVVEDEVEEVPDPSLGTATTPPSPPTVPTIPEGYIPLGDGRYISRDMLDYYAGIDARLGTDEAFRQYVAKYGKAPEPPKPTPADLGLDLDDPNIKFLYERTQELERRLQQTGEVVTQTQSKQLEEDAARTVSLVNRAAVSFQKEHELTDDQIKSLRITAARIGGVDSYMSGTHPITGAPVVPDMLAAIDTALTIAFNSSPEVVESSRTKSIQRQLDNRSRKDKLKKVGGNSGSVPRTPPTPVDPAGRKAAMIEEVRGYMFGQEA